MKSEIIIILKDNTSNKAKGTCFENLVRKLMECHQYDIRGNINFSGMEIDLIANHKHKEEEIYVECKAKEKVSSDELSKFAFNVNHKKADGGYFFRTKELEYQAGALLKEMKDDDRYNHLTFFEPNQIIQILKDSNVINEPNSKLAKYTISKRILAVTHLGDFFIYLIDSSSALPTHFLAINAVNNEVEIEQDAYDRLTKKIEEIKNLKKVDIQFDSEASFQDSTLKIESISEVQESENWYDYLPASAKNKHFVGRDKIRTSILQYFTQIHKGDSHKRIFYLNGKSGWGKSSLVLELKNRCLNKHYKKRFYSVAVDTRSAISNNFVALSFRKLIDSARKDLFISTNMFTEDISFTSITDLLSSPPILSLINQLKTENKFLVLIFDQFEDVFRKKDLFKTFYKFLSDISDKKPNIIIGFSWKTEIIIPIDHEAYHYWQQAKEQAREFNIGEFGEKEIDGVIKQLEDSVGELENTIKNRIKESSQGLPWLTKKLCIHIHEQIQNSVNKEALVESNLNIQDLFEKDVETLNADELQALRVIAKRAYDGYFFDESEVGEIISNSIIAALLHKRLIIRSGANYNIYWDIFRDYLVTGDIPTIGESYLLRQMVTSCLDIFLLFEASKPETVESLILKHEKTIGEDALYNILIELRNIGLVKKTGETYIVKNELTITKQSFVNYITEKFANYTPVLQLSKIEKERISKDDITEILKQIFKQNFQDNTWDAYAKTLISWIMQTNLDIKEKIIEPRKGRGTISKKIILENPEDLLPRTSLKEILGLIPSLVFGSEEIEPKYYRDLMLVGIYDENYELTTFGNNLIFKSYENALLDVKKNVMRLPKMKTINEIYLKNNKLKSKELIEQLPDGFFAGDKLSTKSIYASKALTWIKENK